MEGLVSPSRGAGCTSLSIFQNDLDIWILGTEYLCKNVIPFEHQHPMFMVCVFSFCFSKLKHTSSLVWLYENRYPVLMHMLFKTALWYLCFVLFFFAFVFLLKSFVLFHMAFTIIKFYFVLLNFLFCFFILSFNQFFNLSIYRCSAV